MEAISDASSRKDRPAAADRRRPCPFPVYLLILAGFYSFPFPYIAKGDSLAQWAQIHGLAPPTTIHAIGHTIFLKFLFSIWDDFLPFAWHSRLPLRGSAVFLPCVRSTLSIMVAAATNEIRYFLPTWLIFPLLLLYLIEQSAKRAGHVSLPNRKPKDG